MFSAFEDFTLDTDRRELCRDATLIAVEPQVFDLIAFFIANRHRVVSRDNLIETVWKGRIVSDSTLDTRVNAARRALADSGAEQRLIRTIHGKGFRFVGEVVTRAPHADMRSNPNKLAIAVLPFHNLSRDPSFDSLAAGLTEHLTGSLSQVPAVSVIAGRSAPARGGTTADVRRVAATLGARYVLTGSVQASGRRLRVTVHLSDAAAGSYLWSDCYDHPVDDILALQDDVVRQVLIEACATLTSGDHALVNGTRTRDLNAWLLWNRAFEEWSKFDRTANFRARRFFQKAHEADPQWPSALAGLSSTYREAAIRGWGGSREGDLELATACAERGVQVARDDPIACTYLGQIRLDTGRIEEGVALCEKAVELAPSDFVSLCNLAFALPRVGDTKRALAVFARARKARPTPFGPNLANEGFVLHLAGKHDRTIEVLTECLDCSDVVDAHVRLAAAYVEADRPDEARAKITQVLSRVPDATIAEYTGNMPFPDRQQLGSYRELLREAGLPERA